MYKKTGKIKTTPLPYICFLYIKKKKEKKIGRCLFFKISCLVSFPSPQDALKLQDCVKSLGTILLFKLGKWGHDRVCEVSRFLLHLSIIFFFYVTKKKLKFDLCSRFCFGWPENPKIGTRHRLFWWRRSKLDTTTVQLFFYLTVCCLRG